MKELIINEVKTCFTNDETIEIKDRLLGGMSNYTYVVSINEKLHTVRLIGKNGNFFVDRKKEQQHLIEAKKMNLIPETIHFNEETGNKISLYLEGNILSQFDYVPYLDQIVETLKKVHVHESEVKYDYELVKRLDKYQSLNPEVDPVYTYLKSKWIELYHDKYESYPKTFCHGDAQRSNMILKNEKLYLMDWEFSGYNDPYYDIASFGNIDFNDAIVLLESYIGNKPTEEELKRLKFYRMYQSLQWYLVAKYKHEIGLSEELHIDFEKYSEHYLKLADKLYNEIK